MHLLEEGKSERKEEERGRATGRKHPQPFIVHLNGGHLHLATVLVSFSEIFALKLVSCNKEITRLSMKLIMVANK